MSPPLPPLPDADADAPAAPPPAPAKATLRTQWLLHRATRDRAVRRIEGREDDEDGAAGKAARTKKRRAADTHLLTLAKAARTNNYVEANMAGAVTAAATISKPRSSRRTIFCQAAGENTETKYPKAKRGGETRVGERAEFAARHGIYSLLGIDPPSSRRNSSSNLPTSGYARLHSAHEVSDPACLSVDRCAGVPGERLSEELRVLPGAEAVEGEDPVVGAKDERAVWVSGLKGEADAATKALRSLAREFNVVEGAKGALYESTAPEECVGCLVLETAKDAFRLEEQFRYGADWGGCELAFHAGLPPSSRLVSPLLRVSLFSRVTREVTHSYLVRAAQRVSVLLAALPCPVRDAAAAPSASGFLQCGGVLYAVGADDAAESVSAWVETRHDAGGHTVGFADGRAVVRRADEASWGDLRVWLGEEMVYRHHGECDHVIRVDCMVDDDTPADEKLPQLAWAKALLTAPTCAVCCMRAADYYSVADPALHTDSLLCSGCAASVGATDESGVRIALRHRYV